MRYRRIFREQRFPRIQKIFQGISLEQQEKKGAERAKKWHISNLIDALCNLFEADYYMKMIDRAQLFIWVICVKTSENKVILYFFYCESLTHFFLILFKKLTVITYVNFKYISICLLVTLKSLIKRTICFSFYWNSKSTGSDSQRKLLPFTQNGIKNHFCYAEKESLFFLNIVPLIWNVIVHQNGKNDSFFM